MSKQYGLSLAQLAAYLCGNEPHGFPEAEIQAAQARIGAPLPAAYRTYLRDYGASPINQAYNHINAPEEIATTHQILVEVLDEWREDYDEGELTEENGYYPLFTLPQSEWGSVTENYVLIWYENQGVWNAGYLLRDLQEGKADPPVYISTEDDFITFASTGLNTEGFLLAMFLEAAWNSGGRRLQKPEEINALLHAEGIDPQRLAAEKTCLDDTQQKLYFYEAAATSPQLTVVQKNAQGQWIDLTPALV